VNVVVVVVVGGGGGGRRGRVEAGRKEGLRGTTRVLRRKARKVGSSPGRCRAWGVGAHLKRRDVSGEWVSDGEGGG